VKAPIGRLEVVFSSRETLKRKRRGQRAPQRAVVVAALDSLLRSVFSVLFPSDCRICRTPLTNISRVPVCGDCLAELCPARVPQCIVCGDRLTSAQLLMGDGRCTGCRDHEPAFDRALSFAEYKGALRGLIHLLKYENVTPAAGPLGQKLAEVVSELLAGRSQSVPLLIPVPLHKGRRRTRGFNQAELIARAASKHLDGKVEIAPEVLVRHRETISQVGLSREERIENMHDAFRVVGRKGIAGRTVILVDDVMTTGTTLSECARVLKQAGAERVWAATVARAFQGVDLLKAADGGEQEEVEAVEVAASV
jgi:ComF family protein